MRLVISSGHGKHIRGASGYLDEVDEARRVVDRVAVLMRNNGHTVYTFHDDVSTSQNENLERIVDYHNGKSRDLDVSVHFNAYETTNKPMGCEVLYVSSTGNEVANNVVNAICEASGLINRGPKKRTDLYFLNSTEEPAVLIETCFVDSKTDEDIYNSMFEDICGAIAASLAGDAGSEEPAPPPGPSLTMDQVVAIMTMADNSAIARYEWEDRGEAPIGMTEGLAVMFAHTLLRLKEDDDAAIAMSEPIGDHEKDALAYYGIHATGRENVLRKLFAFMYGLAMRESSGNYTEGRDMSASNVSADTAEAGMFQQSWNSHSAAEEMEQLLPAYHDEGRGPSYHRVFERGITKKNTDSYGSGDGYDYQELAKSNPAFAVEMVGVGLRCLYNHWGPIVRYEVEMRAEAEVLLQQVQDFILEGEEPPPPDTSVEEAKALCMAEIEAAVDQLIATLTAD